MSQRIAAIDCGTNSIRLLVSDVGDGVKSDVTRQMRIVRLGQGVDQTGVLAADAVERTMESVREYAQMIDALDVDTIRFCATSAARDAANAEEFSGAVEDVLGVRPVVLSGDREAQSSFQGAVHEFDFESSMLIDIGGGSSELIAGRRHTATWSTSVNIGSVRMTERYLGDDPPTVSQVSECIDAIDAELTPVLEQITPVEALIGVAGTVTTIAAHVLDLPSYDPEALHRARLPIGDVTGACLHMAQLSIADRRALPFMHPGRADVIGGGALILDRLITQIPLATQELVISEHDILDGIVLDLAGGEC